MEEKKKNGLLIPFILVCLALIGELVFIVIDKTGSHSQNTVTRDSETGTVTCSGTYKGKGETEKNASGQDITVEYTITLSDKGKYKYELKYGENISTDKGDYVIKNGTLVLLRNVTSTNSSGEENNIVTDAYSIENDCSKITGTYVEPKEEGSFETKTYELNKQ